MYVQGCVARDMENIQQTIFFISPRKRKRKNQISKRHSGKDESLLLNLKLSLMYKKQVQQIFLFLFFFFTNYESFIVSWDNFCPFFRLKTFMLNEIF